MTVQKVSTIQKWQGLSGDTKPTSAPVGSMFYETDTGKEFVWNGSWVQYAATLYTANLLPITDNAYNIGSVALSYQDLHVQNLIYATSVAGNWVPSIDDNFDLGENSTPLEWKDLYVDGVAYIDDMSVPNGFSIVSEVSAFSHIDHDNGAWDIFTKTSGAAELSRLRITHGTDEGIVALANSWLLFGHNYGVETNAANGTVVKFRAYEAGAYVDIGSMNSSASKAYWTFDRPIMSKFDIGIFGDGAGVPTGATGDVVGIYPEVASGTTISDTVQGLRVRMLVNAAQTADSSIYAIQGQLRLKANVADGSHAGLFGYVEESGGITLASPGFTSGVSAAVETSSGFTLDSGAILAGVLVSSNAHDDGTFNGNYDAIHIRKASGAEIWQVGLHITASSCTLGADFEGTTVQDVGLLIVGDDEGLITIATGGTVRAPSVIAGGTGNIEGADLTITPGAGTGTGDVGQIIFKTYQVAAGGDNLQTTLETILTLDEDAATWVKKVHFQGNLDNNVGSLNVQGGVAQDVSVWGAGSGVGRQLLLNTATATDGQANDSPTITLRARYDADPGGGVTSTNWDYDILHDMVTAGASPMSRATHSINSVAALSLENDDGAITIILSDGEGGVVLATDAILRPPNLISGAGDDNVAGADFYIKGALGRGAGDVGQIIFQTAQGAAADTVQTYETILTLDEDLATWAKPTYTTSYHELLEMAAPGQGAANTVRIYALEGGGGLTDLAAVFQDGTVDIFAQEVTPPDSPLFEFPDNTPVDMRMRKPDRKTVQFVATFPDGREFVMREFRYPTERW